MKFKSTTQSIIAKLAIFALVLYFIARAYYLLQYQKGILDIIFASMLFLAEMFTITQSIGFILNINRLSHLGRKKIYHQVRELKAYPSAAVVVATHHEKAEILEKTIITLKSINYPNKNIYILDGSSDQKFIEADKNLAEKYRVNYFHPETLHGAKAGTINEFLKNIKEDYLAVFDADQNPMPDFLIETIKIAEKDKQIAFVQTPQLYSNIGTSPIAKGAALQQSIFYESICEAKSLSNAMFCCGTNVLFNVEKLKSVGGFEEKFITEDFATSVKLHAKGYKSVYYNHTCAFGMAPETLSAYFKQQSRWAAGTLSVFRNILLTFIKNPKALKIRQWWEYFLSGSYYLMGWAFFILMICPIVYLLFGVPSFFMNPYVYFGTYAPYLLLSSLAFYSTMRNRNYKPSDIYYGIILGLINFPILMAAAVKGLFFNKLEFVVTPKNDKAKVPLYVLWPWLLMIIINVSAIIVGSLEIKGRPYSVAINIFWCIYHLFILIQIFKLNKAVYKQKPLYNLNG